MFEVLVVDVSLMVIVKDGIFGCFGIVMVEVGWSEVLD